jgi:hypothetical protein
MTWKQPPPAPRLPGGPYSACWEPFRWPRAECSRPAGPRTPSQGLRRRRLLKQAVVLYPR